MFDPDDPERTPGGPERPEASSWLEGAMRLVIDYVTGNWLDVGTFVFTKLMPEIFGDESKSTTLRESSLTSIENRVGARIDQAFRREYLAEARAISAQRDYFCRVANPNDPKFSDPGDLFPLIQAARISLEKLDSINELGISAFFMAVTEYLSILRLQAEFAYRDPASVAKIKAETQRQARILGLRAVAKACKFLDYSAAISWNETGIPQFVKEKSLACGKYSGYSLFRGELNGTSRFPTNSSWSAEAKIEVAGPRNSIVRCVDQSEVDRVSRSAFAEHDWRRSLNMQADMNDIISVGFGLGQPYLTPKKGNLPLCSKSFDSANPNFCWLLLQSRFADGHFLLIPKSSPSALDSDSGQGLYYHDGFDVQNRSHSWCLQAGMILSEFGGALDANTGNGNSVYVHSHPDWKNPNHLWKIVDIGNTPYKRVISQLDGSSLDAQGGRYGIGDHTVLPSDGFRLV